MRWWEAIFVLLIKRPVDIKHLKLCAAYAWVNDVRKEILSSAGGSDNEDARHMNYGHKVKL